MTKIILATLNARYIHCAFGLRYLWANLGELKDETKVLEFTIRQPTLEILDAILEHQPQIVGLGIYIWNVEESTRLVADLKRVRPEITVVLGGPEVSYETEDQVIVGLADHVIGGEADLAFAQFCRERLALYANSHPTLHEAQTHLELSTVLEPAFSDVGDYPVDQANLIASPVATGGRPTMNRSRAITAPLPALNDLALPYHLYTNDDIAHRVIYVEASRGCPFTCEFCLSALEIPVRQFPLETFLEAMDSLLLRGARQFKFVDRTFNLNLRVGRAILEFFLARYQPGLFLHFEMIPDRLPEALKALIARFPAGALQFEVGIQTFNQEVCKLISRQQDNQQAEENLRWLRNETGVHVHADLIVGLPGESFESFGEGFDRLVSLRPHEIQVGILKRLRGTPIVRHDTEWRMVYSPHPPYEILSNKLLDYEAIQELRRFAKYWDAIANSGNFVETLPHIWSDTAFPGSQENQAPSKQTTQGKPSPFAGFRQLVIWLFAEERKTHGIALGRLLELIMQYLVEIKSLPAQEVAASLWRDYQRGGRNDKPKCLRPFIDASSDSPAHSAVERERIPKRQSRHHPA